MKKILTAARVWLFGTVAVLSAIVVVVAFPFPVATYPGTSSVFPSVSAEDDEEDEEDEEDEDDDDHEDDDDDDDEKKETVVTTRYEKRLVTQIVWVLPEAYRTDTDGDALVDGVDPDPSVHQSEYFTDDDDDAIPNVFDKHPGEDDFAFYEGEDDADGNGILDSYERQMAQL